MTKRAEIKVLGSVQGVSFRYYTVEQAKKLGLLGFVRNEPGGSVQIIAEGEEENLKELVSWCYDGVKWAKVDEVKVKWAKVLGEFKEFDIRF